MAVLTNVLSINAREAVYAACAEPDANFDALAAQQAKLENVGWKTLIAKLRLENSGD